MYAEPLPPVRYWGPTAPSFGLSPERIVFGRIYRYHYSRHGYTAGPIVNAYTLDATQAFFECRRCNETAVYSYSSSYRDSHVFAQKPAIGGSGRVTIGLLYVEDSGFASASHAEFEILPDMAMVANLDAFLAVGEQSYMVCVRESVSSQCAVKQKRSGRTVRRFSIEGRVIDVGASDNGFCVIQHSDGLLVSLYGSSGSPEGELLIDITKGSLELHLLKRLVCSGRYLWAVDRKGQVKCFDIHTGDLVTEAVTGKEGMKAVTAYYDGTTGFVSFISGDGTVVVADSNGEFSYVYRVGELGFSRQLYMTDGLIVYVQKRLIGRAVTRQATEIFRVRYWK